MATATKKTTKKTDTSSAQARANAELKTAYAKGTTEANSIYGDGSLGRLAAPTAVAGVSAPNPIDRISTTMEGGSQSIAQAADAYDQASQHDAMVTAALSNLQALTGGMSAPEMNATRASDESAMKTSAATNLRALKVQQASSGGATGAAAGAQQMAVRTALGASERQEDTALTAQNFSAQLSAGTAFSSAATTADSTFQSAKNNALQTLLGARQASADYTQKSQVANQTASSQDATNKLAADTENANVGEYNTTNSINTAMTNLSQAEKEKAGYVGVKYGQAGVDLAAVGAQQTNDLSKQAIAAAQAS